jgi:hypothetical protein
MGAVDARPSSEASQDQARQSMLPRGIFSSELLRPGASPGPAAAAPTPAPGSVAPAFSAFAAALPRPAPPTWPRNPPPIEAGDLDKFLRDRGSPMAGMGEALLDVGWRYNLDPRLLVAIAGADTGFGRVLCTDFNAWNWFWFEWCNSPFESWRQALDEVARGLRMYYLDQGLTDVDTIARRYGPLDDPRDTLGLNRHWPRNVIKYLEDLGGSRCDLTWVKATTVCGPRPTPLPGQAPAPEEEQEGEEEPTSEIVASEEEELSPEEIAATVAWTHPSDEPSPARPLAITSPTATVVPVVLADEPVLVDTTSRIAELPREPEPEPNPSPIADIGPSSWELIAVVLLVLLIVGARTAAIRGLAPLDRERIMLQSRALRRRLTGGT